ncbi:MAG TPA: TolC family protein [Oculatellaceae cyanobacterium]|jgi:Outer membrane efflux protein
MPIALLQKHVRTLFRCIVRQGLTCATVFDLIFEFSSSRLGLIDDALVVMKVLSSCFPAPRLLSLCVKTAIGVAFIVLSGPAPMAGATHTKGYVLAQMVRQPTGQSKTANAAKASRNRASHSASSSHCSAKLSLIPVSSRRIRIQGIRGAQNEALLHNPRAAEIMAGLDVIRCYFLPPGVMPDCAFLSARDGCTEHDNSPPAHQLTPKAGPILWSPAAQELVKEAELNAMKKLWKFRGEVRTSYTEAVVAQECYANSAQLKKQSKRLLEAARKRLQAGAVPELDVLKARLADSIEGMEFIDAESRLREAKNRLKYNLGRPMEGSVEIPRLLPVNCTALLPYWNVIGPLVNDLTDHAMKNRLELKIIHQQSTFVQALLNQSETNWFVPMQKPSDYQETIKQIFSPDKPLQAIYEYESPPDVQNTIGLRPRAMALAWQLYTEEEALRSEVKGEVVSAHGKFVCAKKKLWAYRNHLLTQSHQIARLAILKYQLGRSDITSALSAHQAEVRVRIEYLVALQAYEQSFTDLEQAVGESLPFASNVRTNLSADPHGLDASELSPRPLLTLFR